MDLFDLLFQILTIGVNVGEKTGAIQAVGVAACLAAIGLGLGGIRGYKQEENDIVGLIVHIGAWVLVIWGGLSILSILIQSL